MMIPPFFAHTKINANQELDIVGQLQYGVRSFMVDLYYEEDDPDKHIILAHGPSEKGWSRFRFYKQNFSSPFLETIEAWLRGNPQDIITIHLESYVRNYEKIKEELIDAGLGGYLFDLCKYNGGIAKTGGKGCIVNGKEPDSKQLLLWPTLGEMRIKNERLVVFSDNTEDAGPGIMYVSNTMETKYDLTSSPNCEKRLEGRAIIAPVFVLNHFYKNRAVPILDHIFDYDAANKFNEIAKRVGICVLQEGQWPNFIAIDNVGFKIGGGGDRKIVLAINEINKEHCCLGREPVSEKELEDKDKDDEPYDVHDEL